MSDCSTSPGVGSGLVGLAVARVTVRTEALVGIAPRRGKNSRVVHRMAHHSRSAHSACVERPPAPISSALVLPVAVDEPPAQEAHHSALSLEVGGGGGAGTARQQTGFADLVPIPRARRTSVWPEFFCVGMPC